MWRFGVWRFCALLALASCRGQAVNWNPDPPWSHVPVTVDYSGVGTRFDGSFDSAMAAWNFAAGCDVLAKVSGAAPADVSVSFYDGTMCGQPASLEAVPGAVAGTARCSATSAEVRFRVMSDVGSVFVTAEHEFGHVLGLAHDGSWLMGPSPPQFEPQSLGPAPGLLPLPSDADGAAVGKRYCR